MTDVNIITYAQFKQFAPDIDTSQFEDSTTISGLISAASRQVTDYLEFSPFAEDIVNEIRPGHINTVGDLIIYVAKPPIISVSNVALLKGSTSVNLTLVDGAGKNKYNIDFLARTFTMPYYEVTLSGIPLFVDYWALRGSDFFTSMSYRGGWEVGTLPQAIILATVYYMRELLVQGMNQAGANMIHQGSESLSFNDPHGKSLNIKKAEALLRPYRRIG